MQDGIISLPRQRDADALLGFTGTWDPVDSRAAVQCGYGVSSLPECVYLNAEDMQRTGWLDGCAKVVEQSLTAAKLVTGQYPQSQNIREYLPHSVDEHNARGAQTDAQLAEVHSVLVSSCAG